LRGEHLDAESVDAAASVVAATSGFVVAHFLAVYLRGQPEHQPGIQPVGWRQRVAVPAAAEKWRQQWRQLIERQHFEHRLTGRQHLEHWLAGQQRVWRWHHHGRRNCRPATVRRAAGGGGIDLWLRSGWIIDAGAG
jgi:hypothetical protein